MQPVYFPYTSVSRGLMDASSGFFKTIAVYQMSATLIPDRMKGWQDEKRLDIRLPVQHREKEIIGILKELRTWARLHQGGDMSFFKSRKREIPFFNDSSVAQIRKEIKAGKEADAAIRETDPPDLYPGVFMQMAQDLDEENREIAGNLESQAARAHELIKALKGDDAVEMPGDLGSGITAGDQEAYMIPERIAAWSRIMLGDDLLPLLLVTSNPMVLDELVEGAIRGSQEIHSVLTVNTPIGDAGQLSRCQDTLAAFINDISLFAWDGDNEQPTLNWDCESAASGACLSLYVIPGMTPRSLLGRYLAQSGQTVPGGTEAGNINANTVVGVLKAEK